MIRNIEPKREHYLPLVHRGQQLTNDRQANRIIEVKLKYEGISGKYGTKFHLNGKRVFSSHLIDGMVTTSPIHEK